MYNDSLFNAFAKSFEARSQHDMSLAEYLESCRDDPMMYATAAERLLAAIGEPEMVDTAKDPRLGRIFMNRTIKVYPAFADFYGMEETIERIVGFFRHAAQGLEERKQILYLLGPVGGGKSSLAERLKALMENAADLRAEGRRRAQPGVRKPARPVRSRTAWAACWRSRYGIPRRRLTGLMSPWAVKRLDEFDGDISQVPRRQAAIPRSCARSASPRPSRATRTTRTSPRWSARSTSASSSTSAQNDPDAYSYSGGLNRTTQGLLEFVEMFKAPIKMLHPLLTATQEGNYVGTENIGAIPFQGIILAHSNEAEWQSFKNNKNNEAFIDRICVDQGALLPARHRGAEDLREAARSAASWRTRPARPATLEMLARFSRADAAEGARELARSISKMRVYDGESLKDTDPQRASRCRNTATPPASTKAWTASRPASPSRCCPRPSTSTPQEVAADPVHLMYVLEQAIRREQFPEETEKRYLDFIKAELAPRYAEFIGNEIQKAYLESYSDYGQNLFDRYVAYADAWIEDQDFKDPDTGQLIDRELLEPGAVQDREAGRHRQSEGLPQRGGQVRLRARATNGGKNPSWTSYEKIREVIEKRMFSQVEDLLPVISFGTKKDSETEKKHAEFVERMVARGYTERQVRRLVEWYMRVNKAG